MTANELAWLSTAWHALILFAVFAAMAGWRPRSRTAKSLLVAPAVSVSAAAFAYANPFNASSFALLAVALTTIAATGPRLAAVGGSPVWAIALGVTLVLYGGVYPAFTGDPWYRPLYAAPVGVVPCPTLAVMAGATLIGGGFGSRALPALLAAWTAFYAAFGIIRLGVLIDAGLVLGAIALLFLLVHNQSESPTAAHRGRRRRHASSLTHEG